MNELSVSNEKYTLVPIIFLKSMYLLQKDRIEKITAIFNDKELGKNFDAGVYSLIISNFNKFKSDIKAEERTINGNNL